MDDMVERVARAIAKRQGHIVAELPAATLLRTTFAEDARAAIAAMREPPAGKQPAYEQGSDKEG
jgi:hypothetical protein